MKSTWFALVTSVLLGAAGCVSVSPPSTLPVEPAPTPHVDLRQLEQHLGALPGVTLVLQEGEMQARYDGEIV